MEFTRREFLIASGITGVVGTRAWAIPEVIYAGGPAGPPDPRERMLMTLCRQCPGGCGLRIRVVDENVVGIAGNPDHPINRGGVCPRAPAALQSLYNPDRLIQPRVLAGPKGSGEYNTIEWSDAVGRLSDRLQSIRANAGPQGLAVMLNGDRGLSRLLWSRFLAAYGSNNLIDWSFREALGANPPVYAMQGLKHGIGYDLGEARYVLSFSSQWLDAHWSPAQASSSFAELRRGEEAIRPRLVHFEPRLSLTGAKADEWIPVRPGTEGALALGIAHVILREGLFDHDFIESSTHGFEDPEENANGRIGFRRMVLRDYAPTRVSALTGVETATIFRIAREFATNRPAVALGFDGSGPSRQRSRDRMAIHALNALVGSIDVPGGVTHFQDLPLLNQPMPAPDAEAQRGLAHPPLTQSDDSKVALGVLPDRQLAERILADVPHPIEVLIIAGANPVFDSPHPERMKEALSKIPFVVSLSPWLDDTARWADLIIPETHFLMRWDVDFSHTLKGHPTVTIGRPVVVADPPVPGSADLILNLAREICEPTNQALPYADAKEAVRAVCDTIYQSGRGGPLGPEDDRSWTQLLERSGWRRPAAATSERFYERLLETGGWSDPIYYHREWDRVFRSPPRRFAFHSSIIATQVKPTDEGDDLNCLPYFEPLPTPGDGSAFPLQLYVYPLPLLHGLSDANLPWLIDSCGTVMGQRWNSWVEINPHTAHEHHINEGDQVVITSSRGEIQTRARLFEGIMPGVVAVPWGLGHEDGGRWSNRVGKSPAAVVDVIPDSLTSEPFWNATLVSIRKGT